VTEALRALERHQAATPRKETVYTASGPVVVDVFDEVETLRMCAERRRRGDEWLPAKVGPPWRGLVTVTGRTSVSMEYSGGFMREGVMPRPIGRRVTIEATFSSYEAMMSTVDSYCMAQLPATEEGREWVLAESFYETWPGLDVTTPSRIHRVYHEAGGPLEHWDALASEILQGNPVAYDGVPMFRAPSSFLGAFDMRERINDTTDAVMEAYRIAVVDGDVFMLDGRIVDPHTVEGE
jgi:hypothetical protein